MHSPLHILQQYWKYDAFRPQQEDIITSVLQGHDTFALLPTGGGKSVCYQVPALLLDGICLVISPLIALMKDQVEQLLQRHIPAAAIHSGMTAFEVRRTLDEAVAGQYKFLYLSPERLESGLFTDYLHALQVGLVAVDEAHCISQWGYDFRPPYLRIAQLRKYLPGVPVLAVTASATPEVQQDIMDQLLMKEPRVFRQSFSRPNLSYSVFNTDSKINKVIQVLNNVPGSSIIYCRNRRQTKETAHLLGLHHIAASFYHAGLAQEERNARQEAWINNHTRVMVCTNAFGMGIDKPDVRTVIHYDVPDCPENYYQEAGRAGRDGQKAYAVLLYRPEDITALEQAPDIRYPVMYDIRKVYQALADYLQIPVGSGQGRYFDFDLGTFAKNFRLDVQLVVHVLKVLEQEGHLDFNESIFLPSQVCFTIPKELLLDYETSHPNAEPMMKCLLRTYEGILGNRVSVHERQIAKLMRLPEDTVKQQLHQLAALGVIEYLPQKENPQIHFITDRAPAQFLYINHADYLQRKQRFEQRVSAMLSYIHAEDLCRSSMISAYFGETEPADCGICDNCLKRKRHTPGEQEFTAILERIRSLLKPGGMPVKDLLQQMQGISKDHVWKVLDFLQAEQQIAIDEFGVITGQIN